MPSVLGESQEDKKIRKFIEGWRPKEAPEILRQLERNAKRKPQMECHACVGVFEDTTPAQIEVCNKCLLKTARRYGNVGVISVRGDMKKSPCEWCSARTFTKHKVAARFCRKCYAKLARREREHYAEQMREHLMRILNAPSFAS